MDGIWLLICLAVRGWLARLVQAPCPARASSLALRPEFSPVPPQGLGAEMVLGGPPSIRGPTLGDLLRRLRVCGYMRNAVFVKCSICCFQRIRRQVYRILWCTDDAYRGDSDPLLLFFPPVGGFSSRHKRVPVAVRSRAAPTA